MSTNGPNVHKGDDGKTIDIDAARAAWKAEQARRKSTADFKPASNDVKDAISKVGPTPGIVGDADITTIANEKPENIAPPTSTSKNKSSGTLTYDKSYTPEVAKKWEAKGGTKEQAKANYIKAAKAWNTKKYGTTNPTAKAKKMTGGSKTELASEHAASQTKVERRVDMFGGEGSLIKPEGTGLGNFQSATKTQANDRLQQAVASANSSESLMSGTKTRREKRRQRQDDRIANRRQRQDDRVENRQQRQENRKTKDFSDGVYSTGAKATKSTMPSDKVISAMGKALSTSGTPKTETKKKKTGGEFWGKSGPIK